MLRGPVGLREEVKMLRETWVCSCPASSLFGCTKWPQQGAGHIQMERWLKASRQAEAAEQAAEARREGRGGSDPMSPARLSSPSLAPHGSRCKAGALIMCLHYWSILLYVQNHLMPI